MIPDRCTCPDDEPGPGSCPRCVWRQGEIAAFDGTLSQRPEVPAS